MITLPFDHMIELWEKARTRAESINQRVLISYTKKIEEINPLSFFQNSERDFQGQRFFWSNPDHSHTIVGAGITAEFTAFEEDNRYHAIEKEWKRFTKGYVCQSESSKIGPVIFGGFSFDPKKEKTSLWNKFADAAFVLPTFMLTRINGDSFLTVNYLSDCKAEELQNFMNMELELLKRYSEHNSSTPSIVKCLEMDPSDWKQSISKVTQRITEGEMEKVVLARELRVLFDSNINIVSVVENLLKEQVSSYIYSFEQGSDCFLGATPEQLVKKKGENVQSMCLAGSIARGTSQQEDDYLGQSLLHDEKNLHEHELVVQMIKESLEKVCQEVITPEEPSLYKMKHIQHLHTPVEAKTNRASIADFVKLLHPTPALGGFPQEVALETIREVEKLDRGWYAGPMGWMDANQDGEFIVAIRSGLLQGREASLFAGCGIVGDSDPESEYRETQMKFKPMLSALGGSTT